MFGTLTYEEWLRTQYQLIAGAEDGDDPADGEETDPSGSGEGGDDPASGEGEEGSDPSGSADGGEEEESEPADADDDELDRVKRERDEARDRVARAEAAAKNAKAEARKAREDAAKKHGNWEQVAKERESELAEANEKVTAAEQRAVTAEENLDKFQREVRVTRISTKLSFRDPQDAIMALKEEPEKTGDDKSCERALRELAKQKPYLIDERRARGRALGGSGNGTGMLTKEQMEKMSPEEINAAWEKGLIQTSMAGVTGPSGGG